jgi:hypothetical protein
MDSPTLQDFPHRPIDWPAFCGPHTLFFFSFLRPSPHTENLCLFFQSPHTHTHPHIAHWVSTHWWRQFNNQWCYRQMETIVSGFSISERSTNTCHSCSNCRLMDYWWKKMSGRIFHPSPKTLGIGCLCQCSNSQHTRYGQMDVRTLPSLGTLAKLGFFFLLIALTYLPTQVSMRLGKHPHSSKFSTLTSLRSSSINIWTYPSYANSLPTSTLKLTVGIIFWEGVVFWIWAFWTGIAAALYNMDWSL